MIKPLGTRIGEGKKSRWSSSGPKCPQCTGPLVKRNNTEGKYYECPRHGFIREIIPMYQYSKGKDNA